MHEYKMVPPAYVTRTSQFGMRHWTRLGCCKQQPEVLRGWSYLLQLWEIPIPKFLTSSLFCACALQLHPHRCRCCALPSTPNHLWMCQADFWVHFFWDRHWFRALDFSWTSINTSPVTVVLRATFLWALHKPRDVLNLSVLSWSRGAETGSF